MLSATDNVVAADLLNEIDLNRSCELAQKRYDYEEFFNCIVGIFEDLDLFRCKMVVLNLDIPELVNDWMLD